jgi:hypothetical protein
MSYLGIPTERGLNAFHWQSEIDGREVPRLTSKSGPKPSAREQSITALMSFEERKERREAKVLRDNSKNSITFSKSPQSDADKTARLMGKQNNRRSQ